MTGHSTEQTTTIRRDGSSEQADSAEQAMNSSHSFNEQSISPPYPNRRHDNSGQSGRHWGQLGLQHTDVRALAQPGFVEWLDRPRSRHARGPGLLTSASTDHGRRERQFLFTSLASDRAAFEGAAQYTPLLWDDYAQSMPSGVADAILNIQECVATSASGPAWRRQWRPLSVQITFMEPHDVRGEHNDNPAQGTFIATYTAQGSGVVRLYYAQGETPPDDAPPGVRAPLRRVMERQQSVGHFYCMYGSSLERGTYHGVSSGDSGRLGLTFRFTDALESAVSAPPRKRARH